MLEDEEAIDYGEDELVAPVGGKDEVSLMLDDEVAPADSTGQATPAEVVTEAPTPAADVETDVASDNVQEVAVEESAAPTADDATAPTSEQEAADSKVDESAEADAAAGEIAERNASMTRIAIWLLDGGRFHLVPATAKSTTTTRTQARAAGPSLLLPASHATTKHHKPLRQLPPKLRLQQAATSQQEERKRIARRRRAKMPPLELRSTLPPLPPPGRVNKEDVVGAISRVVMVAEGDRSQPRAARELRARSSKGSASKARLSARRSPLRRLVVVVVTEGRKGATMGAKEVVISQRRSRAVATRPASVREMVGRRRTAEAAARRRRRRQRKQRTASNPREVIRTANRTAMERNVARKTRNGNVRNEMIVAETVAEMVLW